MLIDNIYLINVAWNRMIRKGLMPLKVRSRLYSLQVISIMNKAHKQCSIVSFMLFHRRNGRALSMNLSHIHMKELVSLGLIEQRGLKRCHSYFITYSGSKLLKDFEQQVRQSNYKWKLIDKDVKKRSKLG